MTIYAIVNNLMPDAESQVESGPVWAVVSPSSILQGGNPYFVPDFDTLFEAHPALAIKIGKLGKSIAVRFVNRYVESVAPAAIMVAANLLKKNAEKGLPWSMAISYDRSVAIGRYSTIDFDDIASRRASLTLTDESESRCASFCMEDSAFGIETAISMISQDNALKTGDIILIGISKTGLSLRPGLRATIALDGEESLRFNIR